MPNNTREKRFFEALKNVFVGVPVEGESGYINLMRIKARYFEKVMEPRLRQEIDKALKPFPDFREELFDKLYTFFRRYFTESGSIGFFFTPYHQSIYEQVYTNEQDVVLFWKTARLYYVKTDRLFRGMKVELDGFRFFFDVSQLEHKRANEKRELIYAFQERQQDGTIVFTVHYSEKGRQTKIDDIRRAIRDALGLTRYTDAVPSEETLQKAFRLFERQSEVDYFLCKDAKSFLREQFDLWMWQYLLGKPGQEPQTEWTETRLTQLQALKRIAYRVIDYIAAFEDELVKIWNKPKFVRNSHYVITLDRIAQQPGGMKMLERLWVHPNMEAQIQEWRKLGMVDDKFQKEHIWEQNLVDGKHLHPRYRYLPIDTKYFPELELPIIALFDNLDEALDGWLVRSENYQALNTMLPKFRQRVRCIYIDPPYNSPETEIHYVNRFRDASWLSLMANRLTLAKEWLHVNESALIVAIDDYEVLNLGGLLLQLLPNFDVNTFVIRHHPQGSPKNNISRTHEYVFVLVPEGDDFIRVPRPSDRSDERPFMRTGTAINNFRRGRPNSFYAILVDPRSNRIVGIEDPPPAGEKYPVEPTPEGWIRVYPIDSQGQERVWRKTVDSARRMLAGGLIFCRKTRFGYAIFERTSVELIKPESVWTDSRYNAGTHGSGVLFDLFGSAEVFLYPKSVYAVQDFVSSVTHSEAESLILDFFAGSGTTAHAVINLNREDGGKRKYILVEMADYFYTVLLPRIKKVVFSDKWKDGKAQPDGKGISHFVKYYELEQYEDTLRRTRYLEDGLFTLPSTEDPCRYIFLRDPKMLEALEVNPEKNTVRVDLSKLYPDIDLAETLSNLTGKWIQRIHPDPENPSQPAWVEFADGETVDLKNPDWRRIKPLIWW